MRIRIRIDAEQQIAAARNGSSPVRLNSPNGSDSTLRPIGSTQRFVPYGGPMGGLLNPDLVISIHRSRSDPGG